MGKKMRKKMRELIRKELEKLQQEKNRWADELLHSMEFSSGVLRRQDNVLRTWSRGAQCSVGEEAEKDV